MTKAKSLKLATAFKNFKKGQDVRNLGKFENQIAKFIDEQIDLKQKEIKVIEEALTETSEENTEAFTDSLLTSLEGLSISNVDSRKDSAVSYVVAACNFLKRNEDYITSKDDEIAKLDKGIARLKQLRIELENIEVKVEEEV